MFDQNGIWQDDIYHAPGPSGGATGVLDLMNVMQSGQNYNQEHAMKILMAKLGLLKDPNVGAVIGSPEAATALQSTPDDLQMTYANTPSGKYDVWAQQHPDATTEQMYAEQALVGKVPPSSLGANVRATGLDQGKMARLEKVMEEKFGIEAGKNFRATIEGGVPLQDAWDSARAMPTGTLPAAGAQALPKVAAGIASTTAGTGLKNARATMIAEQTKWVGPLAEATVGLRGAEQGLAQQHARAVDIGSQIQLQLANGAVKPGTRMEFEKQLVDLSARIADERMKLAKIRPDNPQYQAISLNLRRAMIDQAQMVKIHNGLKNLDVTDPDVSGVANGGAPAPEPGPMTAPLVYDEKSRTISGLTPPQ